MSLPTTRQSRAGIPPRRARVLVGASQKVGKTTLLGNWAQDTTLIVDTQNGTLLLEGEHYVSHVSDWPAFVGVVNDLAKGGHNFHTVGLDLVNDLWRFADLYHGKRDGTGQTPASAIDDYGKSRAKAVAAFNMQISRLLSMPIGIWFLTHLREKTDKKGELVVYVPDLDKNVHAYIAGAVDFLWLAEVNRNGDRIIHTKPTQHFEAGSRVPLASPLPMDVRAIALAMDRGLNPQNYDDKGKRIKPDAAAAEKVAETPEKPAEVAPPERKDAKRTGKSDIPSDAPAPAAATGTDDDVPWGDPADDPTVDDAQTVAEFAEAFDAEAVKS